MLKLPNLLLLLHLFTDLPSDFMSDKYLSEEYLIQIDVESSNNQKTIDITKRIRYLLYQQNLIQASSQLDAYFEETKRYVMSRTLSRHTKKYIL